jgi:hypothetical protein
MTDKRGPLPTDAEFDELLAFLPRLYEEGFEPVLDWGEPTESDAGALVLPAPLYHEHVIDLVDVASRDVWTDYEYRACWSGWRI